MTSAPDDRTVRAGDLTVGYLDEGDGPPLVLVHGAESDRTQFTALRAHLGGDVRAISYDQRDTGLTQNPPRPFTLADLADDLAHLLDALAIERTFVLGTSYGGMITQHVALRHRDRLAGIVLIATTPSTRMRSEVATRVLSLPDEERKAAMLDLLLTPAGIDARPDLAARGRSVLATRTPEQHVRRMAVTADHHVIDRLDEIVVPTLVIHGTDDPLIVPNSARALGEGIPGAQLRWIDGGRHGIATEFPELVAADVRTFMGLAPISSSEETK